MGDQPSKGWGYPQLSKRAHYFVDGVALCRRWHRKTTVPSAASCTRSTTTRAAHGSRLAERTGRIPRDGGPIATLTEVDPMTYQKNAYQKFIDSKGLDGEALDRFEAFIATGYSGPLYTRTWDEIAAYYKAWRRADRKAEPGEAAHYRCDG